MALFHAHGGSKKSHEWFCWRILFSNDAGRNILVGILVDDELADDGHTTYAIASTGSERK